MNDIVNFEIGQMIVMHPPDDWSGSTDDLIATSHPEGAPCAICEAQKKEPVSIGFVTSIEPWTREP